MGADLAESVRPGDDGSVYVDAVVSPSEEARFEALGYRAVGTIQDQADYDAVRSERSATIAEEQAALTAARTGRSAGKAKSLAADNVQAQRADYFENYAGKFISIEGYTSAEHVTGNQYDGPILTAAWLDGSGNVVGSDTLSAFVDDGKYLYHTGLFRVTARPS